jgi:predicted kinase
VSVIEFDDILKWVCGDVKWWRKDNADIRRGEWFRQAFNELLDRTEEALTNDQGVIISGFWPQEMYALNALQRLKELDSVTGILVWNPPEVVRRNLQRRWAKDPLAQADAMQRYEHWKSQGWLSLESWLEHMRAFGQVGEDWIVMSTDRE